MRCWIRCLVGLIVAATISSTTAGAGGAAEPALFTIGPAADAVIGLPPTGNTVDSDKNEQSLAGMSLAKRASVWDITVGAAILTRGTQTGATLLQEFPVNPPFDRTPYLLASQLGSNWAGGLDVGGTRQLSSARFFDACSIRYFDVQGLHSVASVDVSRGVLGPAWPNAPVFARDGVGISTWEQSTNLFSFEANRVVHGNEQVDWLAGFRWLGINDSLSGVVPLQASASGSPVFGYEGGNSLYGGQAGAALQLFKYASVFSIVLHAKSRPLLKSSGRTIPVVREPCYYLQCRFPKPARLRW